jgi:hypothetical protein
MYVVLDGLYKYTATNTHLQLKYMLLLAGFNKIFIFSTDLRKPPQILNKIPYRDSRGVLEDIRKGRETDRCDEANSFFS